MKIDRAYAALVRAAESEAPAARGAAAKTGDPTMKLSSSGNNLVAEGGGTDSMDMKANFSKTPNGIDVEMGHDAETAKKAQAKKEKEEKAALAQIEAKKASKAVSRVWSMIKPEEYKFLYTGILGACIAGFNNPFVGIVFVKVIRILYMTDPDQLESDGLTWCLIMIVSAFFSQVGEMMKAYGFGMMKAAMTQRLRHDLYAASINQNMAFYDLTPASKLTSLLGEETAMVPALTGEQLGQTIGFAATLVFALGFGFGLGSWKVGLVFLGILPLMMAGMVIEFAVISGGSSNGGVSIESTGAKAANIMGEAVSSIRTVYSYNLEKNLMEEFATALDQHLAHAKISAIGKGSARAFSQCTLFIGFGLVYYIGNGFIIDGEIEPSKGTIIYGDMNPMEKMLLPIFCMFMLAAGFGSASMDATDMGKAKVAAVKLFDLIDRKPTIDRKNTKSNQAVIDQTKCGGQFVLDNVAFTYPSRPELPVYTDLTVDIQSGTTVAFVGSSGSGKSTLVQLVERFYDPSNGSIKLDGIDLKDLDVNWLRRQIGMVGQEPVLFSGSIKDNIALGKEGATDEEIIEAAKSANAHDFIMEQPKGYDTGVGTGGGQLSGGQKQRVAIARAIIKNPPILLLDEATSALDNESERVVQEALDELLTKGNKRTTLVIAHRLTTIQSADKIIVLDHGNLVEQGTHAELMASGGQYATLSRTMR
jgi:ATP-binding cassette subfamily B (MDR/TAP) protein 1